MLILVYLRRQSLISQPNEFIAHIGMPNSGDKLLGVCRRRLNIKRFGFEALRLKSIVKSILFSL